MKQLIARYDGEWKERLGAIARSVATAGSAPAHAYALDSLETLPPVRPSVILNAGGNYVEHTEGIAQQQQEIREKDRYERRIFRHSVTAGSRETPR